MVSSQTGYVPLKYPTYAFNTVHICAVANRW